MLVYPNFNKNFDINKNVSNLSTWQNDYPGRKTNHFLQPESYRYSDYIQCHGKLIT